jgi:hypothetical protein
MIAGIFWLQSAANFMKENFDLFGSQVFELFHTLKGLLLFYPAFCFQDMITYLVFSAFPSRPTSLLVTNKVNFILLSLITQTILDGEYRSLSYSLYSFLYSPISSLPR